MSEYTPTTDEVRAVWREWNGYGGLIDRTCPEPTTRAGMVAEFDRWLARVKADAWVEGWADCDEWRRMAPAGQAEPANPYEEGRHVDQ